MDADYSTQYLIIDEINDSKSVLDIMATMYEQKLMSDIWIIVGDNKYVAHRAILSASSDVFKPMLSKADWNGNPIKIIELAESPSCTVIFPQFLKFLYVGQAAISLQTALPMLTLATKYNIKPLISLCIDYMLENIAESATEGYFVSWLQSIFVPTHINLTHALKRFLKWNLQMVTKSREFGDLDIKIMTLLLQQNDLVVSNEFELFGFLEKWLFLKREQLQLTDDERNVVFLQLIESTVVHIRFAMMTPRELAHLLLNPITAYHKEFLVERMAIGMSYHSGQEERVSEIKKTKLGALQFTPRLYSNDVWSQSIFIKEFEKIEKYQNFVACFFSQRNLAEREDDQTVLWEIEFFPRGVKYDKAKVVWGEEIPEFVLKTVRLRVICRESFEEGERFKIAVLITGVQNKTPHMLTIHEKTEYFSQFYQVLDIDNLLPYDELNSLSLRLSPYLTGPERNNLCINVIIAPMGRHTSHESPLFEI